MKRAIAAALIFSTKLALASDPATVQTCLAAHERSNALRKEKHLRDARSELLVCAQDSCPGDIRAECSRGVVEVTNAMPTLVVSVHDAAHGDLLDVAITIDAHRVASHLDGTAIPLDPGPHEITIDAPGHPSMTKTLVLLEGEKDRRETFTFAAPDASRVHDPTRRTIGVVTVGAGLAGVVLGVVAGGIAASSWSTSQSECASTACGASAYKLALSDHDSAQLWANVSTASFIAGGALLAIGGVLFFTAPWIAPGKSAAVGLTFGAKL